MNLHSEYPSPLSLCHLNGFDLIEDARLCPLERNVLRAVFLSAKGREWTESKQWLHEYSGHCNWYGVTCNEENKTVKLELHSNALSGTLSPDISQLDLLEILDLGDNDIKVGPVLRTSIF